MNGRAANLARPMISLLMAAFLIPLGLALWAPSASAYECVGRDRTEVTESSNQSFSHTIDESCLVYVGEDGACALYEYHYEYSSEHKEGYGWTKDPPRETSEGVCVPPRLGDIDLAPE